MYCIECAKVDKNQKMKFAMLNFTSGVWLCPRKDCLFPLNSERISDYVEDQTILHGKNAASKEYTAVAFTAKSKAAQPLTKIIPQLSIEKTRSNQTSADISSDSFCLTSDQWASDCSSTSRTVANLPHNQSDSDSGFANSPDRPSSPAIAHTYPAWINSKSLCWLDVTLVLLCLNKTLRSIVSLKSNSKQYSLLSKVYNQYESVLSKYNKTLMYSTVADELVEMRNQVWQFLQPKLLLQEGDQDSPFFALSLLLKQDKCVSTAVETTYVNRFNCSRCQYTKVSRSSKTVLSLPNCSAKFSVPDEIGFMVNCYECGDVVQNSYAKIEGHPPIVVIHFTQGVPSRSSWEDFNFVIKKNVYTLTQIVQYRNRHFICWCYSSQDKKWMRYNDLYDKTIRFDYEQPKCPFDEGHILVWERDADYSIAESCFTAEVITPLKNITNQYHCGESCSDQGIDQSSAYLQSSASDASFFFGDYDGDKTNTVAATALPTTNAIFDDCVAIDTEINHHNYNVFTNNSI